MKIRAFKGFNRDMTCRDFQYKEGEEFVFPEASLCEAGAHACLNPLDCIVYYGPASSVYHEVEMDEVSDEGGDDSKIVAKRIKIGARLTIHRLAELTVEFMKESCAKNRKNEASNTGYGSMASNTGYGSMASNTGDESMAEVSGKNSIAASVGIGGKARGSIGNWLVLAEWIRNDENNETGIKEVKCAKVDGITIKENTWYKLENGEFKETAEA